MDAVREMLAKMAQKRVPKDKSGLPKNYVAGLPDVEKKTQIEAIKKSASVYKTTGKVMERKGKPSGVRSPHVIKFEKEYGFPITDLKKVKKEFPGTDVDNVLKKGIGAYASGSRPGQSIAAWKFARLASVLTGGKALGVDKDLVGDADLKKILA